MAELFKNKYRVNSLRLQHWDYSWPAMYFITICTKNRECNLGEIKDCKVHLAEIGKIIFKCWLEISEHFNNVKLDDWVIMPNHLHGIIVILDNDNDFGSINRRDTACHVSTVRKFGYLQPKSLSSIIGSFKSAVTNQCNKNDLAYFQWQTGYYEHIIKNEEDYARIKKYIAHNPINWEFDHNNPLNIKLTSQSPFL